MAETGRRRDRQTGIFLLINSENWARFTSPGKIRIDAALLGGRAQC
jgi:hypothetical protein